MGTRAYPRTEAIMVLARKAVNCPHGDKAALKHLSDAHDAVERLERDMQSITAALAQVLETANPAAFPGARAVLQRINRPEVSAGDSPGLH